MPTFQNSRPARIPWHAHGPLRNWAVSVGYHCSVKYLCGSLAKRKSTLRRCMKNISLVQLVGRVLHSSHNARLQSHLRFWADSEHPISQLWSATKNISGRCSQRTMREDTLKNTPLLTNSLFCRARWCVCFWKPDQCCFLPRFENWRHLYRVRTGRLAVEHLTLQMPGVTA